MCEVEGSAANKSWWRLVGQQQAAANTLRLEDLSSANYNFGFRCARNVR
jgi:hypothetical protein